MPYDQVKLENGIGSNSFILLEDKLGMMLLDPPF